MLFIVSSVSLSTHCHLRPKPHSLLTLSFHCGLNPLRNSSESSTWILENKSGTLNPTPILCVCECDWLADCLQGRRGPCCPIRWLERGPRVLPDHLQLFHRNQCCLQSKSHILQFTFSNALCFSVIEPENNPILLSIFFCCGYRWQSTFLVWVSHIWVLIQGVLAKIRAGAAALFAVHTFFLGQSSTYMVFHTTAMQMTRSCTRHFLSGIPSVSDISNVLLDILILMQDHHLQLKLAKSGPLDFQLTNPFITELTLTETPWVWLFKLLGIRVVDQLALRDPDLCLSVTGCRHKSRPQMQTQHD